MGKYEIKKTKNGGYMFNLIASNGEVVATSQTYTTLAACKKGIESVCVNGPTAPIEDQTLKKPDPQKNPKFEIYQDNSGDFRFRLRATNGNNIIAGQGYKAKSSCKNGIESVRKNAGSDVYLITD